MKSPCCSGVFSAPSWRAKVQSDIHGPMAMASASAARTLVALLVVSCLSGLVVANDAGSGGDVGNSTSTAYSLNATNATYFGNLTYTSDEDDYYSVSMPNNTGIYVELISPGYSGSNGTNSSSTCYNSSWPLYTATLICASTTRLELN